MPTRPPKTSDAMWAFVERMCARDPDLEFAGTYVLKRGYHSSVEDNQRLWPNDYSIRLAADLRGNKKITRGIDLSSKKAKRGDYSNMVRYGDRIEAAFKARDPRLRKWREALGQKDPDAAPEGFDFQGWYERVPDGTHSWHWHLSILTEFAEDWNAYLEMESVLLGESFEQFLRRTATQAVQEKASEENRMWFAKRYSDNQYFKIQAGLAFPIKREQIGTAINVGKSNGIYYTGPKTGDGLDMAEWEQVWFGNEYIFVRGGFEEPTYGYIYPPALTVNGDVIVNVPPEIVTEGATLALESQRGQSALIKAANEAEDR